MAAHPAVIRNALSFDIEDWFHIIDIQSLEDPSTWPTLGSIVERRTDGLLKLLDHHKTQATFFILGWIAERHPTLIRRIANAGHELGSHSFWHRRVYLMSPEAFRQDTVMSLDAIESACGVRPKGYRAPSFSIIPGAEWALDVILDCGIQWDASLFPSRRGHGGYPCGDAPHMFRQIPSGRTIPELPLANMRIAGHGLCFSGGGYLRLLPTWFVNLGFKQLNRRGLPAVVYLHPRDFAPDCPRVKMPLARKFKCYVGLGSTEAKLEAMLRRHAFAPCGEVLKDCGLLPL